MSVSGNLRSETSAEKLNRARIQVRSAIRQLAALERELLGGPTEKKSPDHRAEHGLGTPEALRLAKFLIEVRRTRSRYFKAELFGDPPWDIMLALYVAHGEQQRLTVTSVCTNSGTAQTTALRWMAVLEKEGWIERRRNPLDARIIFVGLTSDGFARTLAALENVPIGDMLA